MKLSKILLSFIIVLSGILIGFGFRKPQVTIINTNANQYLTYNVQQYRYLSDIGYLSNSKVGYSKIILDQNLDGELISLYINNHRTYFLKGVFAHATSNMYYDISSYDYDYFTTYVGVDASRGELGNGVKFRIYTSNDGETWDLFEETGNLKGTSEAVFIKVPLENVNYLRLEADNLRNDSSDHAVYANAKLIKADYEEDLTEVTFFNKVEDYDNVLKQYSVGDQLTTDERQLVLLQRTLVKNVGYDILQAFAKYSSENEETLKWLMSNKDVLEAYLMGGKPVGNYVNSLKVLVELYETYKNDLQDPQGGPLYLKMMLTLSLTHSSNVCLWIKNNSDCSNATERYAIYKKLYQANLLNSEVFTSLQIEEMRWVLNSLIDDEEIEWLNEYAMVKSKDGINPQLDPYAYITYKFGYNYDNPIYYDLDNFEEYDNLFQNTLSKYGLIPKTGYPKLWNVFMEGSVCGGLSKTGSNLQQVYGIPAAVIGQPGHAAYLVYRLNANGEGMWSLYNDVSGWGESEKSERMLLGWGSTNWDSYYQVSYVLLAQAALNDYDNYVAAEKLLLLEDLYATDYQTLEKLYNKVLTIQPINIEAWYGLIKTYEWDTTKTSADYLALAQKITTNLKNYPLPMYDLLKLIEPHLDSKITFDSILATALENTRNLKDEEYIQASAARQEANYLSGKNKFELATFSFEDNTLSLSEQYQDSNVTYRYCLSGLEGYGDTVNCYNDEWTQTNEQVKVLSNSEMQKISPDNGIAVQLMGASVSKIYVIDIIESKLPTLYNNDNENILVGDTSNLEWRYSNNSNWTKYTTQVPNLDGDQKIEVRVARHSHFLESPTQTFNFTADSQNAHQKYVPISRLSIAGFSTEEKGKNNQATYALDGNINTIWHTAWDGSDTSKYIDIKVDQPIYLSRLEYYPRQDANNGRIISAKLFVSDDGENWQEVAFEDSWPVDKTMKSINLETPVLASYIRLQGIETSGPYASASMINLYEDATLIKEEPTTPEDQPDLGNKESGDNNTPTTPNLDVNDSQNAQEEVPNEPTTSESNSQTNLDSKNNSKPTSDNATNNSSSTSSSKPNLNSNTKTPTSNEQDSTPSSDSSSSNNTQNKDNENSTSNQTPNKNNETSNQTPNENKLETISPTKEKKTNYVPLIIGGVLIAGALIYGIIMAKKNND